MFNIILTGLLCVLGCRVGSYYCELSKLDNSNATTRLFDLMWLLSGIGGWFLFRAVGQDTISQSLGCFSFMAISMVFFVAHGIVESPKSLSSIRVPSFVC
ncbi:MAG: hypothetical protein QM504_17235 [Pseudomonadota bacterium]